METENVVIVTTEPNAESELYKLVFPVPWTWLCR